MELDQQISDNGIEKKVLRIKKSLIENTKKSVTLHREKKPGIIPRNFVVLYHGSCLWYKIKIFMALYLKFIY